MTDTIDSFSDVIGGSEAVRAIIDASTQLNKEQFCRFLSAQSLLREYVVDHAGDHDEECPCDDTCNCKFKQRNLAVDFMCKFDLPEFIFGCVPYQKHKTILKLAASFVPDECSCNAPYPSPTEQHAAFCSQKIHALLEALAGN